MARYANNCTKCDKSFAAHCKICGEKQQVCAPCQKKLSDDEIHWAPDLYTIDHYRKCSEIAEVTGDGL